MQTKDTYRGPEMPLTYGIERRVVMLAYTQNHSRYYPRIFGHAMAYAV